jgi:hypothetical protein
MFIEVEKEKFRALIFTASLKIEGTIHLLPQERMTDYLGEAAKPFIPVTEATVFSLNKNEIIVISPLTGQ